MSDANFPLTRGDLFLAWVLVLALWIISSAVAGYAWQWWLK